ncbi:hypothetical protein ECG_08874 [Echinococcus granulosus]|uniref:Uncharacterized protein n=1 Tax=Echinococcus granulosus TaxID=6210 RepID=W6U3Y6_ECHGR|nr:hypothetical protein EGR_09833 [Echinococcus granulosus]EUB55306.1 hypothetical protein EGR_09833 [Echinococcus granulosus]KAH9278443.1 hypothetical protein ECG_08874 [Echinococcus granulosus]
MTSVTISGASLLFHSSDRTRSDLENTSFSEIDHDKVVKEVTIRWETVVVGGVPQGDTQLYTTTYTHIPPLAQETPEDPDLPPSFRDPLRHLHLNVDKYYYHDDADSSLNKVETRKHGSGRVRFSVNFGVRHQKRFLHTPPNKYLPIPPLVRTPYFYAYGRCPVCAGNVSPVEHSKGQGLIPRSSRDSFKVVANFTKNGPLDHLEGKNKVQIDDLSRRISLHHLKSRVSEAMSGPKPHLHLQHGGLEEGVKAHRRLSGLALPQTDPFHNKNEGIPSFASARQLTSRSKCTKTSFRRTILSDLHRFKPRYQLKPHIDDFKDAVPGGVILASKLKDYDCHVPLVGVDTTMMRELYTATILRDHVLNRLYHRRNFRNLPPEFQYLRKVNFLEFLQAKSWMTVDSEIDRDRHLRLLTTDNSNSILDEIANHFYECDFAELHVFTNWLDSAKADETLLQLKTCKEIKKLYLLMGEELTRSNLGLGGTTRMELLIVLATSINNQRLRHCLWGQVRCWLDPLIGGLFSTSKCVREESCYTLAYMFSINSLAEDIRHLLSYDIPYDVTWNVLKAMDLFPETFMTYFLLLGYMLEGCSSFSILNCIMERAALCSNPLIQKRWPLFVYYAIKHWNAMYLRVDPVNPALLMEKMTLAAMNPLTRKAAKMALVALAKKFDKSVGAVTHFDPVWTREEE